MAIEPVTAPDKNLHAFQQLKSALRDKLNFNTISLWERLSSREFIDRTGILIAAGKPLPQFGIFLMQKS
jgi:hypothetical protein